MKTRSLVWLQAVVLCAVVTLAGWQWRPLMTSLGYLPEASPALSIVAGSTETTTTTQRTTTQTKPAADPQNNRSQTVTETVASTNPPEISAGAGVSLGPIAASADIALPALFDDVAVGLSRDALLDLTRQIPACSIISTVLQAQQELCTWVQGNDSLTVVLLNNKVITKAKIGF